MAAMKGKMIRWTVFDPGNIIRSIADAATSQSENDDHNDGEGIGDWEVGAVIVDPWFLRVSVIPEWSVKSFLYCSRVKSQVSDWKKVICRGPKFDFSVRWESQ